MDIAGLSTQMSSSRMNNQVGIAMLSKSLDQNQSAGNAVVGMIDSASMERAVNPAVGSNFDVRC